MVKLERTLFYLSCSFFLLPLFLFMAGEHQSYFDEFMFSLMLSFVCGMGLAFFISALMTKLCLRKKNDQN